MKSLSQLTSGLIILLLLCSSNSKLYSQCALSDFVLETSTCDGTEFLLTVTFDYDDVASDSFDLTIYDIVNNVIFIDRYAYENLPVDVSLQEDISPSMNVVAQDIEDNNCVIDGAVENPCFVECSISDIVVETTECQNNMFTMTFDFDYSGNTNDFFDYEIGNIASGTVAYADLPLTITIESDGSNVHGLLINDNDNPNCSNLVEFIDPCFEDSDCILSDLVLNPTECDGNEFELVVDFNYSGTTNDFFDYEIPGLLSGFALFTDLPITISVQNAEAELLGLVINENDNPNCFLETSFENPCYEPVNDDCAIGDIEIEVLECEDNIFDVWINFEYENTSDQFILNGNGNSYGTFSYADLPITLTGLEADCETDYEFVVHDVNDNDCTSDVGIGVICCESEECVITTFDFVDNPVCENGLVVATWLIDGENISEVGFDIFIDSEFQFFVQYQPNGSYEFELEVDNNDPLNEVFVLTVCDNDNEDCCISWDVENPCYEPVNDDCAIGDIETEVLECEDNIFDVWINFEYENTSDQFILNGNGNSYGTFSYADLPITLTGLEADCETDYEFVVHDVNDNDCTSDVGIGVICCQSEECVITTFDFVDNPVCENGLVVATWLIDGENISEVGFDIFIDGEFQFFVEYESDGWYEFELEVDNNDPLNEVFVLTVCDNDNEDCCISWDVENPCYEPVNDDCGIGDIETEILECEDNIFDVWINFEYENTSNQFILNGNGNSYGTFSYADLPITLTGLEADCETDYEFVVHDMNDNDCTNDTGIGVICCESEECAITTLDFGENLICEDGLIVTEWLIDGENLSEVGFDIFVDGAFQLFVQYQSNGWYGFDLEVPNVEIFVLTVCDNDNEECCFSREYENPCYEDLGNDECGIGDIETEILECEDNIFDVWINFEYENTSNQFILNGNGNNYGTFSYADLPITLTGLEADCETDFEFVIHDVNDNDCTSDVGIGVICCESEECAITTLDFGENPICEDGLIVTEWLIDGENLSEVGFDIFVDGAFQLFVQYQSNGWYDFDLEVPNVEIFVLTVCDNDNEECCFSREYENPCYEDSGNDECHIEEIIAEVQSCQDDLFDITIDFDFEGISDSFSIVGNGNNYGLFSYQDLPITISELEADCTTDFEFVVIDSEDNDCSNFVEFGTVCCTDFNSIDQITVETALDGEIFRITYFLESLLLPGCSFEVWINEELYTTLTEDNSSFEVGPFECGTDGVLQINLLNTCNGENTLMEYDLGAVSCSTNVVDLDDLVVFNWNASNLIMTFDFESKLSLDVQVLSIDGRLVASHNKIQSNQPASLSQLSSGMYFIRVVDQKSNSGFIKKIIVP